MRLPVPDSVAKFTSFWLEPGALANAKFATSNAPQMDFKNTMQVTSQDLRAMVREYRLLGLRTLVIAYVSHFGAFYFKPSSTFDIALHTIFEADAPSVRIVPTGATNPTHSKNNTKPILWARKAARVSGVLPDMLPISSAAVVLFAMTALGACARSSDHEAAAAAPAWQATAASAPSSPALASVVAPPAATAAAIDVGDTAAPTALPASADPLVRAVAWTCAEQDCEGLPIIAYDNLPASNADGTAIAFVEERDGWGHVPKPGLRSKFVDGHMQFLATTGVRGAKYASPAAERVAHQRAIDAANSEVHGKGFTALLPMLRAVPAAAGIVKYVAAGAALSFNYKSKQDMPDASPAFSELIVTQDGKEVARRPGKDFPDQAGCSQRKLVVEGVRPERKVIGLTFTNGLTGHNCDGKAEPQVHYVLRW